MDDPKTTKWFEFSIRRARGGTIFTVKADPRVEDFFKGLGSGKSDSLEMFGRTWQTTGDTIQVYNLHDDLDGRFRDHITINQVSGDMHFEGTTNLSFLRFVGISGEHGISFLVTNPMSLQRINSLKAEMLDGVRSLLYEYVVPTDITLELISKEN